MNLISIECDHVTANRDGHRVVDDITLSISPGITYLIGPNGSGKSLFIQLLTTVVTPAHGSVVYFEWCTEQTFCSRKMTTREVREVTGYLPHRKKDKARQTIRRPETKIRLTPSAYRYQTIHPSDSRLLSKNT